MNGSLGRDALSGGSDRDKCLGGKESDGLFGNDGQDWVNGNVGVDNAQGGAGNDIARGGQDTDSLARGTNDDILIGNFANLFDKITLRGIASFGSLLFGNTMIDGFGRTLVFAQIGGVNFVVGGTAKDFLQEPNMAADLILV